MAAINSVTTYTLDGDIAFVSIDAPPINALYPQVTEGLGIGVEQAIVEDKVKAIVIICEGTTFVAGANIARLGGARPPVDENATPRRSAYAIIEESPKPVIAAIHGTALGAGLELAMLCDYRIAVPSAKLGMPEVALGITPGIGGTVRLPRLVGVPAALEMITSGRHVPAQEARDLGLVDELVTEGKLREGARAFARKVIDEHRPLRKVRYLNEKVEEARGHPEIFSKFRADNAKKFRGFLAPEAIIECIEAAVDLPFDDAREVERKKYRETVASPGFKAQRYYFFAEREARKIPGLPADSPLIPIKKVGVIGAGTMGGGIAMNFANAGIHVTIVEQKQEPLDRGLKVIRGNYERTASRGGITKAQVEERMGLIKGSLSLEDFADVDLVIEAVFERMDVKKDIFSKLEKICKPGAILASNTSGLNINEMAAMTTRPEYVIGLHFFSPANVMKLLEIVRADHTSDQVIATSMALAKTIGKNAILVGVCPGFAVNRINGGRGRETQKLIMEGAMPWDVDRALYNFGYAMGPFATGDLAGLDLGWVKERSTGSTIREVMCEMDRRGQKSGAGYYDYDENRNPTPSPVTEKIIRDFRAKSGVNSRIISDEEIVERCVYPLINESLKVLEEGKAIRASDIDVAFVNGSGFPVYRGGPMFYGDSVGGPKAVLAKMRQFQAEMGDAYKPAALLEKLAAEGKAFTDI